MDARKRYKPVKVKQERTALRLADQFREKKDNDKKEVQDDPDRTAEDRRDERPARDGK